MIEFRSKNVAPWLICAAVGGGIFVLFEILIFDASYYDYAYRQIHGRGLLKAAVYAILVFLCFFSLSTIFVLGGWHRTAALAFTFTIYGIDLSYININGSGFGYNELQVAIREATSFGLDAIVSYSSSVYRAAAIVSALFLLSLLLCRFLPEGTNTKRGSLAVHAIFLMMIAIIAFVIQYSHYTLHKFPAPFRIPATLLYALTTDRYFGERERLSEFPSQEPVFQKVIWIIDESIGAQYLSINGFDKPTTPKLQAWNDFYINLGTASAIANCSSASNIVLMSGLRLQELPDRQFKSLKQSSIFQYARNAGYETHYISNQGKGKSFSNFMNIHDYHTIDNFSQGPGRRIRPSEGKPEGTLIDRLTAATKKEGKQFIYVLKKGAHFHWELNYPEANRPFNPTLDVDSPLVHSDRERAVNSYLNNIRWAVDDFFDLLLNSIDLSDTIIFYTADHGQSILEEGTTATHCDWKQVHKSQGKVPLIVIGEKSKIRNQFTSPVYKDLYSLYQLFPTTLGLFGYETQQNISIFGGVSTHQKFYAGELFGRGPWEKFSINE